MGDHNVLHHPDKDFCRVVDSDADIQDGFRAVKKIKTEDDPDYRYWDFRDEILDVERMRTITTGGKNGKNCKEEKSEGKEKAKPA